MAPSWLAALAIQAPSTDAATLTVQTNQLQGAEIQCAAQPGASFPDEPKNSKRRY
jgi:hypothetical protein